MWKREKKRIPETGRFDDIDSVVIISSQFCTALHALLMMTAESMLSKP